MANREGEQEKTKKVSGNSAISLRKKIWLFAGIVLTLLFVWVGAIYATSPDPIRNPKFEHYHFRMQLLVDGKAENFGQAKYQTHLDTSNCNVELAQSPIHFHDSKDQFVHIHWKGMTGGLVLKNYGWNFLGGSDNVLGYRFDNLGDIKDVPIHGRDLPNIPKDSKYYVYAGDETSYVERSFDEFKSQDLETFFGKKSNLDTSGTYSIWNWLFPKASAHSSHAHADETSAEQLERINNLIGNVVIFVQKDPPTSQQVKERFQMLEPLSDSTCAG